MAQTIWLVTHATEFNKSSNTGHLVFALSNPTINGPENSLDIRLVSWSRVQPEQQLLAALNEPSLLIYPAEHALEVDVKSPGIDLKAFKNLIVIDATWQLARKIYNQSHYLQALPAIKLQGAEPSRFLLRRNQLQTGWCTAEIAIILLKLLHLPESAEALSLSFTEFNQRR